MCVLMLVGVCGARADGGEPGPCVSMLQYSKEWWQEVVVMVMIVPKGLFFRVEVAVGLKQYAIYSRWPMTV